MANRTWVIIETRGGLRGKDLDGCLLEETATGFKFKNPERQTLGTTLGGLPPTLPFEFPEFIFAGHHWSITVDKVEFGKGGIEATGLWKARVNPNIEEDGGWTAQAGGGPPEEEAEADVTSGEACHE